MDFRIEKKDSFQIMGLSGHETVDTPRPEGELTGVWAGFFPEYNDKLNDYYTEPFWQIGAIEYEFVDGKKKIIIGAEYKGKLPEGMSLETIPAATWAVFSFDYPCGYYHYIEKYNRIVTEWLPTSGYKRDESVRQLEVYYKHWEIWIPVLKEKI